MNRGLSGRKGHRMEGVIALFIPIALFIAVTIVICIFFYFRYRNAAEIQRTARTAIEQGQELSPEFLSTLSEQARPGSSDLRRGVIAIAIGLGLAAFGLLVGEDDATQPLLAIGSLPLIIGVAYLGLWKFSPRE